MEDSHQHFYQYSSISKKRHRFSNFISSSHVSTIQRSRSISFSVDTSFSSSSSCSSSSSTLTHVLNKKKSFKLAETYDGSFLFVFSDDDEEGEGEGEGEGENGTISEKSDRVGLVSSNVKKQPWKKVLFASDKIKSILLLNVITIVYASNIPVVKVVEEMMDAAAFSAVRFVVSAIPFLPFVFRARDDVQIRNAGIELGLWVSLGYLIEALGLLTAEAGRASFISLITVIAVPLLDGMLGAYIPARTWFGVLMSAIGIGMLECSGSPPNIGDLLSFVSAIFFGIHMLRTEHFSRSTKRENFLPLLGYEVCVLALLSTMWVMLGGWFDGNQELDQSSWTWETIRDWFIAFPWIPALYTGVFSTGLCLWVEIAAMREVSATETAIIYGLEPLWGAGFAWFLLGERWGAAGWVGAALVLGGSLTVQIFGTSTPHESLKTGEKEQSGDLLLEKQKPQGSLSPSPVVRSGKDII
uniref:EamA domain-containing protein n=1 Tax=Salix viminalis TaxID=40686 RepID=A0A6N2KQT7_SALVM